MRHGYININININIIWSILGIVRLKKIRSLKSSLFFFKEINYQLNINTNVWSKLPFCKSKQKKLILSNVSGTFKRGMNAILGKYYLFNIYMNNFFNNILLFLILWKLRISTCEIARQNYNSFLKDLRVEKILINK